MGSGGAGGFHAAQASLPLVNIKVCETLDRRTNRG